MCAAVRMGGILAFDLGVFCTCWHLFVTRDTSALEGDACLHAQSPYEEANICLFRSLPWASVSVHLKTACSLMEMDESKMGGHADSVEENE